LFFIRDDFSPIPIEGTSNFESGTGRQIHVSAESVERARLRLGSPDLQTNPLPVYQGFVLASGKVNPEPSESSVHFAEALVAPSSQEEEYESYILLRFVLGADLLGFARPIPIDPPVACFQTASGLPIPVSPHHLKEARRSLAGDMDNFEPIPIYQGFMQASGMFCCGVDETWLWIFCRASSAYLIRVVGPCTQLVNVTVRTATPRITCYVYNTNFATKFTQEFSRLTLRLRPLASNAEWLLTHYISDTIHKRSICKINSYPRILSKRSRYPTRYSSQ